MTRPEPRRSGLAGTSALTPPDVPPAATTPATSTTTPSPPSPPSPPSQAKPSPPPAGRPSYPHKISIYQDRQDTDRVRAAILYTMTTEGHRNLSQFVNHAVMAEVERLETKYNNGQPFPPVGARELPQGGAAAAATGRPIDH